MENIIRWINENNIRRNRMILSILAAICYTLMYLIMTNVIGTFNAYYMLDMEFFYTGDEFLIIFSSISAEQVTLYQTLHYIDYVFIFTFYPLYVLILEKYITKNRKFILLPLLAMLFDFLENLVIDIHIHNGVSNFFAGLSGVFTLLKFIVIIAGFVLLIVNYIQKKKNKN